MNDVVLNKIAIIERCLNRVNEVYEDTPENLSDLTKRDSIIMNIQRACAASIDIAMYMISELKLGVPQVNREVFTLLENANIIEKDLVKNFMNILEFRDVAVSNDQMLEHNTIETILHNDIEGFRDFITVVLSMGK